MPEKKKELYLSIKNYSVGFLLVRFGQFFLLPLYWKYLTIEEIGVVGLSQLIGNFLTPILSMGQSEYIQRELSHNSDENKTITISWQIIALSTICTWLIAGFFFSVFPQLLLKNISIKHFVMAFLSYSLLAITTITLSKLRIQNNTKHYNYLTTCTFALQFIFSFTYIAILKEGIDGYFKSLFFGSILTWLIHHSILIKNIRPTSELKNLKDNLKYSTPIMISGVFDGASNLFDRYFIDRFLPVNQLGLYTSSNQVGSIYNAINQIFKTAWFPFIFRVFADQKNPNRIKTIEETSLTAIYMLLFISLAICNTSILLIHLLQLSKFTPITTFLPFVFSGLYLMSLGTVMGRGMDLTKKNSLQPLIPIVALALNLSMSLVLVKSYGLLGGYIAFVVTFFGKSLTQIYLNYRVFKRNIHVKDMAFCTATSVASAITTCYIIKNFSVNLSLITNITCILIIGPIAYKARIQSKYTSRSNSSRPSDVPEIPT